MVIDIYVDIDYIDKLNIDNTDRYRWDYIYIVYIYIYIYHYIYLKVRQDAISCMGQRVPNLTEILKV